MKTSIQRPGLSRTLIALAVVLAFGPARAQEAGGIARGPVNGPGYTSTAPESSISVGVGVSSGDEKDRARWGMFNGLRVDEVNGLLGFSYFNRDAASGKWMSLEGRNLGLDNRELGYSYRRLGDFKFNVDYSEVTRHDPRTINTSLQGAGTTTPTVSLLATPGTGQELNLELQRKSIGLILEKQLGSYQIEVNFKNEDKSGARFFGKGFACSAAWQTAGVCSAGTTPAAILMLPEPVDSTIRQLDRQAELLRRKAALERRLLRVVLRQQQRHAYPDHLGPARKPEWRIECGECGAQCVLGHAHGPVARQPGTPALPGRQLRVHAENARDLQVLVHPRDPERELHRHGAERRARWQERPGWGDRQHQGAGRHLFACDGQTASARRPRLRNEEEQDTA